MFNTFERQKPYLCRGMNIEPIAHIHTDFGTKFGIPRQSGVADSLVATIVFEPAYRCPEALRGLEGFSHLWLLWHFSEAHDTGAWSPTVRPPRLGGNQRMGVWATRSPFRPNHIGLSSVRLLGIRQTSEGAVIDVQGADMLDGTPIFDIKPYLPYTDAHPEATGGFTDRLERELPLLQVVVPPAVAARFSPTRLAALHQILAADPRPHYQCDASRVYGFTFASVEVRFTVVDGVITVRE